MNIVIANRLMELRKKAGYSQEELGEKLGISRQAVSKWERAESCPDTDNIICLAKLYGISLDDLLNTDKPLEDVVDQVKAKEGNPDVEEESKEEESDEDVDNDHLDEEEANKNKKKTKFYYNNSSGDYDFDFDYDFSDLSNLGKTIQDGMNIGLAASLGSLKALKNLKNLDKSKLKDLGVLEEDGEVLADEVNITSDGIFIKKDGKTIRIKDGKTEIFESSEEEDK